MACGEPLLPFFEIKAALQERQREPRHSWTKYLCWHKSNYCFELRLPLPFTFSGRIEILLLCCKPSKTLCGRLLWAAEIQSCTRQAEFFCNAAVCIPCLPLAHQSIFVPDMGSRENHLQRVLSLLWQAIIFCLASFLLYLKT